MEWFRSYRVRIADGSNKAANVERRRSRETPKATFESPSAVLRTTAVMLRDALNAADENDHGRRPSASLPESARPIPRKDVGFTIHSEKNGETNKIKQTSPTLTVAKARALFKAGHLVHIADSSGRLYAPSEFDEILKFDRG